MADRGIIIGLSAVIVTAHGVDPKVFVVRNADHGAMSRNEAQGQVEQRAALPFGAFDPERHDTLEMGLREWVSDQTPITPSYVEQLYTFGNKGRYLGEEKTDPRVISVGYLTLARYLDQYDVDENQNMHWQGWYTYFPWEDWRNGRPSLVDTFILPHLKDWAEDADTTPLKNERLARINSCFGGEDLAWDNEKTLERYELLYTARMVFEACADKGLDPEQYPIIKSTAMEFDHRRILATAIGRLRAKIKYRPVVFELMDSTFTLLELQRTVEGLGGHILHKQNFRRLVESSGMVEETGESTNRGGGRPANLFRFRSDVTKEHLAPGMRLSPVGGA